MGKRIERVLRPKEIVGRGRDVWAALVAEFLGPFFIVLIGCGSCIQKWEDTDAVSRVQISLAFGLTVAALVQCVGHISGGHLNPAVTFGMLVTGRVGVLKALLYIVAQCLGAIAGAGILKSLTPDSLHHSLGQTTVNPQLNPVQGFGVEFLITFVLVFVIFAVTDENRADITGSVPLIIGLTVTTCHLFAIPYTGSSMNSARALGPAVITGSWDYHWVYWLGPCGGGIAAAILYHTVFAARRRTNVQEEYVVEEKTRKLMAADTGC
jgi:MIP family channel proteins